MALLTVACMHPLPSHSVQHIRHQCNIVIFVLCFQQCSHDVELRTLSDAAPSPGTPHRSASVKASFSPCICRRHRRLLTGVPKHDSCFAGLGTDNLIKVQCNDVGQMLPEALDKALVSAREQGKVRLSSAPTLSTAGHSNRGRLSSMLHGVNVCVNQVHAAQQL